MASHTQKFKQFKGDVDVFVSKGQEKKYLGKHGIAIHHLSNGALVAGATRHVKDTAEVKVKVHFPHASYYEPVGKRGISHLVEHFIFNKPHFLANEKDAYYNAYTYATHMELIMHGRAHPQVKDYGVLPVVPIAFEEVTKPLQVTQELLKSEKAVVLGELYEDKSDGDTNKTSLFEKTLYAPDHPYLYDPLGTKGEIRGLTLEDVKKYHKRVFLPQGLVATVFVDGVPKVTATVMRELEKRISAMPKQYKKPLSIDRSLFNKINPNYKQGAMYKKDSKKKDKQVKMYFIWLLPRTDYTVQTFAEARFFEVAEQKMFRFFRQKGLGYTAEAIVQNVGDNNRVMGFMLTLPRSRKNTEQYAQELFEGLKKEVFEQFNDVDMKAITAITHKRAVTGISIAERFSDVLTGLREYGRVIDSDKVHSIHKLITPEHLRIAQKTFLITPPTILLDGDLS